MEIEPLPRQLSFPDRIDQRNYRSQEPEDQGQFEDVEQFYEQSKKILFEAYLKRSNRRKHKMNKMQIEPLRMKDLRKRGE